MAENRHCVITLSRQMGSGGTYLGYLLAKQLGFKYVDREIVRQAAQALKTDVDSISDLDGRSSGLLSNLLRAFAVGTPEAPNLYPLRQPIYDKDLFTLESRIMNNIAEKNNAVLIGRGSFYALKGRPGVAHIFAHAPLDFRIQRYMKVQDMTDSKRARAEIEESDARRAKFIKDMTGLNWTNSLNYHLCLDMSKVSFEASLKIVMELVKTSRLPE